MKIKGLNWQNLLTSFSYSNKAFDKIEVALQFKRIRQKVLLPIAILMAIIIALPRVLTLYNITEQLTDTFSAASFKDILFRFSSGALLFWLVLQFNTNWKYLIKLNTRAKRVFSYVLINALLLVVSVFLFNFFYPLLVGQKVGGKELGLVHFTYFIFSGILVFVSDVLRYQLIHKEDELEKERLKQEKLQAELSALKNQVNPHFLFNSLNSLNTLIRDNERATTFVNKLSYLYRYILQSRDQEAVSLNTELKFVESYVHLIKTRYRDRFSLNVCIDAQWLPCKIPVMALQLLVENAVKHNEISKDSPLEISVFVAEEQLIVENKIQLKNTPVDSTGNGLANLDRRYRMLIGKRIVIKTSNGIFSVKLPLN